MAWILGPDSNFFQLNSSVIISFDKPIYIKNSNYAADEIPVISPALQTVMSAQTSYQQTEDLTVHKLLS